jgi:hypothetical protein
MSELLVPKTKISEKCPELEESAQIKKESSFQVVEEEEEKGPAKKDSDRWEIAVAFEEAFPI